MKKIFMIDIGGFQMTNYIVFPDLYKGSALLDVADNLKKEIKKYNLDIKIIGFSGRLMEIPSGDLDKPDAFFNHNIVVLKRLKRLLKDKDKILFVDFFQPGLALLKYYLDGNFKNVKFGSLFHGASFIEGDFFRENRWMKNFELGLLEIMDVVYVPSDYAKNFFNKFESKRKVKVFSFGFNPEEFKCNLSRKKEYDVIIPHRWSWDRDPLIIKKIVEELPEVKFAISGYGIFSNDKKLKDMFISIIQKENVTNLGVKSGKSHYKDLNNSKIVLATRDSFGYSIRKAIACGCVPLATNNSSYPEFLDKENLFNNIRGAKKKIREFLKIYPNNYRKVKKTEFIKILEDFFENE